MSSKAPHRCWLIFGPRGAVSVATSRRSLNSSPVDRRDKLTVAKLDVDANPLTAQRFQVASIPALIAFKDGIPTTRLVDARKVGPTP